jgi:hypothetical protein
VVWFLKKRVRPAEPTPVLSSALPLDHERYGPAPPPPPSATPPGVSVWRSAQGGEALAAASVRRPARSRLARIASEVPLADETHLVVVSGTVSFESGLSASPSDVVVAPAGRMRGAGAVLLESARSPLREEERLVRHEETRGTGITGITGIRVLHRDASTSVLRLGPPPGARWVIVGLRSLAVFSGKLILVDGGESVELFPGDAALIADPTATLYLQAGNDSALGIGFAAAEPVVALG